MNDDGQGFAYGAGYEQATKDAQRKIDALVEALGHLCLEAHHFADNKIGVQFLRAAIDRARAALKAATE